MAGISSEQMALYKNEMYEVSRESYKLKPTQFDKVYKVNTKAKAAGDKYTQLLGADKLTKKSVQGQGFTFRSPVQGWTTLVCYQTYFDAVKFDKEEVEDNVKSGAIGKTLKDYASTWGDAYRVSKEEFAASFFIYGGLTSGDSIFDGSWGDNTDASGDDLYDGIPLFTLTGVPRTTKDGSTYYNAVTSSALNPTNFGTLYDLMAVTNGYNEVGVRVENAPDTLLTQEGSDYRQARKLLESDQLPNGQMNDINPFKGICKAQAWSYLSGGAYYVLKAQDPTLQFDDRQAPVIDFYRNKETRGYMATIDSRFGVHLKPGVWRKIARNGGSAAANRAAM